MGEDRWLRITRGEESGAGDAENRILMAAQELCFLIREDKKNMKYVVW
jgi:hypothetical protein